MKFTLFTLLCCFGLVAYAQKDSTVIKKYNTKEILISEYQVSLPDSAYNGYCKTYTNGGQLLSSGYYKNKQRVGIWIWYQHHESRHRDTLEIYDYGNKKELFSTFPKVNAPRFAGGEGQARAHMLENIQYPEYVYTKYAGKTLKMMYKTNCNGQIIEVKPNLSSEVKDAEVEELVKKALMTPYSYVIPCTNEAEYNSIYLGELNFLLGFTILFSNH